MSTMPIVDLVDVCNVQAAMHRRLFEVLGAWALDDPDPAHQRWYSTAAHRHAWHAELWAARQPAIPVGPTAAEPAGADAPATRDDRRGWYRTTLDGLLDDTRRLVDRFDPTLDPGSVRVAQLVIADLVDLSTSAPG